MRAGSVSERDPVHGEGRAALERPLVGLHQPGVVAERGGMLGIAARDRHEGVLHGEGCQWLARVREDRTDAGAGAEPVDGSVTEHAEPRA